MSLNPDTKVLSYYDVLLRQSDLDLFTGPHWLNDQCIAFYFEYLIHEVYPKSADVLLVPGATSYLLATSAEVAEVVLQQLDFANRWLAIFAVNNSPDATAAGGSHWSLLVYTKSDRTMRHYDSCCGTNERMARQLGASISASVPGGAVFREEACPQQDNGFDCGMYVVAIAKELCSRWDAREGAGMVFDLPAQQFSGTAMRTLRGNILRLILDKITLQQRNNE